MISQTSLGVDLEGRLRVGGNINLIQIATTSYTLIFDIYQIAAVDKNHDLLQLLSNVLKCVFLDPSIRKVFFDGKKDLEALHYILGVGVKNFVDV